MNKIEGLASSIKERLPSAEIVLDPPSGAGGTWWLDIHLGDRGVVVEWRPAMGFGISSTPAEGYGEGSDEFYENMEDAIGRTLEVLVNGVPTQTTGQLALRRLREVSHMSPMELAESMGVRQSTISKMERQRDLNVSTLRRFVQALGGVLELKARFPDRTISIDLGEPDHQETE